MSSQIYFARRNIVSTGQPVRRNIFSSGQPVRAF